MAATRGSTVSNDAPQTDNDDVQIEVLIEDVSIDGMCGVY